MRPLNGYIVPAQYLKMCVLKTVREHLINELYFIEISRIVQKAGARSVCDDLSKC